MTPGQILALLLAGAIAWLMVRRMLLQRSIPQVSAEEVARKLAARPGPVLIDVRTAAERERRTIKGSLHIPVHQIARRTGELQAHRNRELVCFCATGSRSLSAAGILRRQGFQAVSMRGGIADWNTHP
jgi:hydroxyacylglutathione hydrolase